MPILIHGAGLTAEEIGALPLTGGTLTGGLSVPSLTLNGLLATISVSDPNELCMTTNPGDEEPVLLGFIKTPTQDYHAANKAYVDGKVLVRAKPSPPHAGPPTPPTAPRDITGGPL